MFGLILIVHFGGAYLHKFGFFHSTLYISIYDKGNCNNCGNPIIN